MLVAYKVTPPVRFLFQPSLSPSYAPNALCRCLTFICDTEWDASYTMIDTDKWRAGGITLELVEIDGERTLVLNDTELNTALVLKPTDSTNPNPAKATGWNLLDYQNLVQWRSIDCEQQSLHCSDE